MAELDNYVRGVDSIEIELVLTDEDGVVINPNSLEDVQVEIITKVKAIPENTVHWTGTITGGDVVITDATAGTVSVYLEPSDTTDWPICKDYYVRVTKTEVDANYTSGYRYSVVVEEAFRLNVE